MSATPARVEPLRRRPARVRVVTAASLFDGHDAAINIVRRLLQQQGAEVIHLGHDRSVEEVVDAAVQEDAHAVAISSYQGGHMEYFRFLVDRLRERGAGHVRVYGGGGGVIVPEEIEALHAYGVARIFSPEDGRRMGLQGMIASIVEECAERTIERVGDEVERLSPEDPVAVARLITWLEDASLEKHGDGRHRGSALEAARAALEERAGGRERRAPVVGFTGTGGAGKSSVLDEVVRRFRLEHPERSIALLLADPTRRRSGGALLGDRLRMNSLGGPRVFARSLATRRAHLALSGAVRDAIRVFQAAGFDLVVVETAGIGQGDSEIVDLADLPVYVMTPEYGAPSQLEKIDMLDLAELVVLNKFDRSGAQDALRDVRKQWKRNRAGFELPDAEVPVYPTVASRFDDPGIDRLYAALSARLGLAGGEATAAAKVHGESAHGGGGTGPGRAGGERANTAAGSGRASVKDAHAGAAGPATGRREEGGGSGSASESVEPDYAPLIPSSRSAYLAEIADTVRGYRAETEARAERAAEVQALARALRALGEDVPETPSSLAAASGAASMSESGAETSAPGSAARVTPGGASGTAAPVSGDREADPARRALRERYAAALRELGEADRALLAEWPAVRERYDADAQEYTVRERAIRVENHTPTLSGTRLPKVALPRTREWGEQLRFLRLENLPGRFPFTAGVFPFKRATEDPTRMFAGEGGPERTNRRFHYLASGQPAARLSTAFDSVTLYGRDPAERPDVYGKVGTSGVSVCTVDDAVKLYSGFDLLSPQTSVSMTINGPAPVVLAFFLNAAIDQGVEKHLRETGRLEAVCGRFRDRGLPRYAGPLPEGHDGLGLGLLGIAGDEAVDRDVYARVRADVLRNVRGTVQADILKEDQAQNTCIFSTEFALKLMGDVQEHFVANGVRNFYSVSISGYHMAEAGANPVTQLAFTLANGFTYLEYYRARGMSVDAVAPNFSFFFSNGLDAEYGVIGRVARRIWAVALRERYGAAERGQKLKYHVQTSGRSLHAREMAFNDIRTTLQALLALQDHCNSLHTNAYDEAVTTPTEESVRRALAIQLIISRELGLSKNENPLQGSYLIEELTGLVEEAVLAEFERLSARGGVLGAMETLYQRGRIQDESLRYEQLKHSGELPVVGVNTFVSAGEEAPPRAGALVRATEAEKRVQIENLRAFQARHAERAPAALARLCRVAREGGNVFAELMETVKVASLGQISEALFEVGGRYRRAM